MKRFSIKLAVLASLWLVAPVQAEVIDFDSLAEGKIVQNSDLPIGYTISVNNRASGHPDKGIIFDSSCSPGQIASDCSGQDPDLITPGAGVGNNRSQNKVLIIAEDIVDSLPAIGLVDDPDDEACGGTITFTVPDGCELKSVRFIDIECGEETKIILNLHGGGTQDISVPALGNNSAQTVEVPEPLPNIDGFTIDCEGSCAIDDIVLECKSSPPCCGDGKVDAGEECDDGPANSDTDPDACRKDCTRPVCGDGVIDAGETCDDGEFNSDTTPHACRTDCTIPCCGDGKVDAGEECDDGAGNSDTDPDACREDCTRPVCGDGVIDAGEACDDGAGNSDTDPDACREDCTRPVCGDGVIDAGETCDDGAANSDIDPNACRTDCTRIVCGDGKVDPGEGCDEGEENSNEPDATCRENCTPKKCGDGIVDTDEECDDGAANSDTTPNACRTDCTEPICGDGILDTGEECDAGAANSDTTPNTCRADCTLPFCGDSVTDTSLGEQCDPPPKLNAENCANQLDDDGDGLIDCADSTDCPEMVQKCGFDCKLAMCTPVRRDPAIIRFNADRGEADMFWIHGNFRAAKDVDFTTDRFAIILSNENGVIYQGTLVPGEFKRKIGGKGRFVFRDRAARSRGQGDADGIYRVSLRERVEQGHVYVYFRLRAYADFSLATVPTMTTQIAAGDHVGTLTADWRKTGYGWVLKQRYFGEVD